MRRLLLAASVCAAVGVLMGLGYAALTPPPFTAKALIVLPQGAPVPGLGSHITRLTDNVVEVSAPERRLSRPSWNLRVAVPRP